jgi:hypothetical protein
VHYKAIIASVGEQNYSYTYFHLDNKLNNVDSLTNSTACYIVSSVHSCSFPSLFYPFEKDIQAHRTQSYFLSVLPIPAH